MNVNQPVVVEIELFEPGHIHSCLSDACMSHEHLEEVLTYELLHALSVSWSAGVTLT